MILKSFRNALFKLNYELGSINNNKKKNSLLYQLKVVK